jgi:hypothetical protein
MGVPFRSRRGDGALLTGTVGLPTHLPVEPCNKIERVDVFPS